MATNNSGNDQVRESRPRTNNFRKDGKTFSGSGEKREYRPRNNGQGNEERKNSGGYNKSDRGNGNGGSRQNGERTGGFRGGNNSYKGGKVLIKGLTRMPIKKEKYTENLSRKIVSQRNSSLTRWK